MILGGGQCQKCKCIPCDPCEQECTEPHTGDAFEVVYTHYNLGVQAGNLSDGFLTASGDNDTSDPLDGMDGNGPWYQQIEGGFSFGPSVTRHPCTIRVSFWRNNFTLGPTVFPPPAATLTLEEVTVTCGSGKVRVGEAVLEEGETFTYTGGIPLVAGGGDKSEDDPRTFEGTLAIQPVCREASFEVKARIEWNTKQRQHVLYGVVRECYEEGTPCAEFCDGDPAPDVLYLTISNLTVTGIASGSFRGVIFGGGAAGAEAEGQELEKTYVLERVAGFCNLWIGYANGGECQGVDLFSIDVRFGANDTSGSGRIAMTRGLGNGCRAAYVLAFALTGSPLPVCGSWSRSGTSTDMRTIEDVTGNAVLTGSFDWEITT